MSVGVGSCRHYCTSPYFAHDFLTLCGHCMYFFVSSQWSVDRICTITVHLTHESRLGTARLCTAGLAWSSAVFSQMQTEPLAAASPCLHCFERGGAQFVQGACCVTQMCFPPCSFPQTYVPPPDENVSAVKLCQIPRYSALKSRFRFNRPIPRFRP